MKVLVGIQQRIKNMKAPWLVDLPRDKLLGYLTFAYHAGSVLIGIFPLNPRQILPWRSPPSRDGPPVHRNPKQHGRMWSVYHIHRCGQPMKPKIGYFYFRELLDMARLFGRDLLHLGCWRYLPSWKSGMSMHQYWNAKVACSFVFYLIRSLLKMTCIEGNIVFEGNALFKGTKTGPFHLITSRDRKITSCFWDSGEFARTPVIACPEVQIYESICRKWTPKIAILNRSWLFKPGIHVFFPTITMDLPPV